MTNGCTHYLSGNPWLITEEGWDQQRQGMQGTLFAQGNGILGVRGILEELPYDARPGTYIAGLYDRITAQEPELVNLPNPLQFNFMVGGEKVGVVAMKIVSHKRWLDLRNGLVVRRTVYQDRHKRRYDYQSVRFISMADKQVIGMRVSFTPLDHAAEITVKGGIDDSVSNSGVLTEGNKRHFQLAQVFETDQMRYLCVKTLEGKALIAYASQLGVEIGRKSIATAEQTLLFKLKKGQTARFTKLVCLQAVRDVRLGVTERKTTALLTQAAQRGFDTLLKRHQRAMHRLWDTADIQISGDPEAQKGIRFTLYHLMICAPEMEGEASVGAKTLSGEGYRGHIFWDTELFLMPFYILTQPTAARNMLLYRYYRLDAARRHAKETGFKGARFPWESADTGEETTPSWAKDFDGRIIPVRTGELEHHIVADVAYAAYYYATVTDDEEFMLRHGYEMMLETARFWASRVRHNRKTRTYEIHHVIGPDEFHEDINNNAFTNCLAQWNLHMAAAVYSVLKRRHPGVWTGLVRRLKLEADEVKQWKRVASRMQINVRPDGVVEQFSGYFKRRAVQITSLNKQGLPGIPVGLDLSQVGKTQFIKQADVVMLTHVLNSAFSHRAKKANYDYYLRRTLHKSSLSLPVHAAIGSEVGDHERAYKYFLIALNADLKNHYDNTHAGIHGASLGGVWQAVVNGFGGVRILREGLEVNPRLPKPWQALAFSLHWRGVQLEFQIKKNSLQIQVTPKQSRLRVPVKVGGKRYTLRAEGPLRLPLKATSKGR